MIAAGALAAAAILPAGSALAAPAPARAVTAWTSAQADHLTRLAAVARPPAVLTVGRGNTLSSLASSACGAPSWWPGLYDANRRVIGSDPGLIRPGEHLVQVCRVAPVPRLASPPAGVIWKRPAVVAYRDSQPFTYSAADYAGAEGFQACVIRAESGGNPDIWNATGHWGLYQFSAATWAAYGGDPAEFGSAGAAEQTAVFDTAIARGGQGNWAPYDGC